MLMIKSYCFLRGISLFWLLSRIKIMLAKLCFTYSSSLDNKQNGEWFLIKPFKGLGHWWQTFLSLSAQAGSLNLCIPTLQFIALSVCSQVSYTGLCSSEMVCMDYKGSYVALGWVGVGVQLSHGVQSILRDCKLYGQSLKGMRKAEAPGSPMLIEAWACVAEERAPCAFCGTWAIGSPPLA